MYIPGSVEKKRAVVMYFGLGIFLTLSRASISPFEFFHLKQALGWWAMLLVTLVLFILLFFIPVFWVIGRLIVLILLGLGVFFIRQAWNGLYGYINYNVALNVFASLGSWLLQLFDVRMDIVPNEKDEHNSVTVSTSSRSSK